MRYWGCQSAAWHHIVTFCKFWEWLAVIFRIQRSSFFMLKPLRSHCKAMCYRKLANCFGRGTAIGGIHDTRNVLAMVLPLCLQRSEGDGTCLPPVGWNLDDCRGPECWLEGHAPLGLPYSAAWHHIVTLCKFWEWLAVIFRIQRWPFSMLKPLRSHCKAMSYRKLANCFGRGTAMGGIHTASNICNEADSACLPPVWLKCERLQRPREYWLEGSAPVGFPIPRPDITLCKFWEWLAVIFRIQRSSFFMLKPLRSHCKAMCYRKLDNCFGRGTAMGGIHTASSICNEADSACLPPVWLKCERMRGPREYWLEGSAPVGLP